MALVNTPPIGPDTPPELANWYMQVFRAVQMIYGSGTTANRPTKDLRPGGYYWNTTTSKANFINTAGTGWCLADGTPA